VRLRFLGAVTCSLAITMCAAPCALAVNGPGGIRAASPTSRKHAKHVPEVPLNAAPVTARTSNIAYTGPVYEKTSSGEVVPYQSAGTSAQAATSTGGAGVAPAVEAKPQLLVPGSTARWINGIAAAPMQAPAAIQQIIWSGDQIVGLPYIYGGGHASFTSPGYDCSGTVSFALHGADLLASPEDSSEFEGWGASGIGRWVTIFANPEHAYMTVAGLRLDTSAADDPSGLQGPRWRPLRPANEGFVIRHPVGL